MKSCLFETLEKQTKWPEGALFQIFHFNMGLNYPTEVIIEIPKKIKNTPLRDHCVLHTVVLNGGSGGWFRRMKPPLTNILKNCQTSYLFGQIWPSQHILQPFMNWVGGGGCTDTAAIYPEQIFCTKVEQKHPLFLAIFSFLNANLLGVFRNAFILALL